MAESYEKHITWTSVNAVDEICKPLLQNFDITFFNYVRLYDDGTNILLLNNRKWITHCVSQPYQYPQVLLKPGAYLWDVYKDPQNLYESKAIANNAHGITIVNGYDDYLEVYDLATTPDNYHLNHFYMNNINLLSNFLLYFKEKAFNLINDAEKQPTNFLQHTMTKESLNQREIRNEFLQSIKLRRYRLKTSAGVVSISHRELECLSLYSIGWSAKQVGKSLEISPRTVEDYIARVKTKLGCFTKADLLEVASKNHLPFIERD